MMPDPYGVNRLERKLSSFVDLSSDELECLARMQEAPRGVKTGQQLVEEGQRGQKIFVIHQGWACSYKDLRNGSRQIISFPIAGDWVGLRSALLKTADHSFSAITDAVVTPIDPSQLINCLTKFPRLGTAFLWAATRDEAIVVEHLVNLGRRTAVERTAHFFLELAERLTIVGLGTAAGYRCPLNQYVIADALGMTSIHVNRVLRQLRQEGLLTLKKGEVQIHDLERLKKIAGYEGGYLGSLLSR